MSGITDPIPSGTHLSTRRHDLDWVRIGAFALLILYHTGMYYVSWDWHVKSPFPSHAAEPFMMMSSPWRLSLLFFVSGVATAFMLRRGDDGFIGSRSRRLLIPLAFGMLVVVAPQTYFEMVEKTGYDGGYLAFLGRYLTADKDFCVDSHCLIVPTWNHLWFVAYLWVYSVSWWMLRRLFPRGMDLASTWIGKACAGWGVIALPIAVLALIRITLVARFPSTHAMAGDWFNHAQYASVFALGAMLAHHDAVWDTLRRLRWLSLALAVASYAFIAWYFNGGSWAVPDVLRQLQRVVYATDQWASIAAILGFARHWSPGDSAARRYLTQAIFPFYIVHQTAIVVMAHALKPVGLSPAVEAPLLIVATFGVCFATFEIVRRVAWLRPLFGLTMNDRSPRPSAAAIQPAGQP
jgi:glucan biosynthesis protein C